MRNVQTLILKVLIVFFMSFVIMTPAQASLINDDVTVRIFIPNLQNFDQTGSTTVSADSNDAFTLSAGSLTFNVDPFASGVSITLTDVSGGGGIATLSPGLIAFTDLAWVGGPPGNVVGVTVTENLTLFSGTTDFGDDFANVLFSGSSPGNGDGIWVEGQTLTINLDVQHVPVPSAMLLMGTGLLGLIGWQRWSHKTTTSTT